MADPLSIGAGVAGLVSLGIQVTHSLLSFYASCKSQDSDLLHTTQKLGSLLDILQSLNDTLSTRKFSASELGLVQRIEKSIKNCEDVIHELEEECRKFNNTSKSLKAVVKVARHRATYPFRRSTLQKLDEDIHEILNSLSLGLEVLQLKDNKETQDDIIEVKQLLNLVRTSQISSELLNWLKAPDVTINHNAACAKRHPGSGLWLVKSSTFEKWLQDDNSFLWLNGFAGCGKSVLCSTAILHAFRHRGSNPHIGIAFFYFTFNDKSKQDESAMLRALLLQLSTQLQGGQTDLTRLHESYKHGTPPSPVMLDYLRHLIKRFDHVYIFLDALDESPRSEGREAVLETLESVRHWSLQGLHLLVTSRDEQDIHDSLCPTPDQKITMRSAKVDEDINDFIKRRLKDDPKLHKWTPFRDKIQKALIERAKGVFRWVECQFKSLQTCPRSEIHLERLLNSLPRSLDETYERLLSGIGEGVTEECRRILTLLCFASRPLTVPELIDGIATELDGPARFNRKRRLQDATDIREICLSLVEIDSDAHIGGNAFGLHGNEKSYNDVSHGRDYSGDGDFDDGEGDYSNSKRRDDDSPDKKSISNIHHEEESKLSIQHTQIARIAHFSVQEYLESERIRYQKASMFSLKKATAHAEIAQVCLVYLLYSGLASTKLSEVVLIEYPLAHYAAMYWYDHYTATPNHAARLDYLILELFKAPKDSFENWIRLHDLDRIDTFQIHTMNRRPNVNFELRVDEIPSPLYYASFLGLDNVLLQLIGLEKDNHRSKTPESTPELAVSRLINARCRYRTNALQGASHSGFEKVVQILLDHQADVNNRAARQASALQMASYYGHEKVVRLLIANDAYVNAQGGHYGNALQAASCNGHIEVVQLLLDHGADVHALGGFHDTALAGAARNGHESVVLLLLKNNADVNAQGGAALQAASGNREEQIVRLLLANNANVNARGPYGTALTDAVWRENEKMVQLLLEHGADVNARGTSRNAPFKTALEKASRQGNKNLVQLLLEREAYFGSALQEASSTGYEEIVQLLLGKGANIDAQDDKKFSALDRASFSGQKNVMRLLLEKNAHVGDALVKASYEGQEGAVQLLMEGGADIDALDYGNSTALEAALSQRHKGLARLLLEKGACVRKALSLASHQGYENMVKLMLDRGADINAQGPKGTALEAASYRGHIKLVQLLLNRGARTNPRRTKYTSKTILETTIESHWCKERVVQLLLEKGAPVGESLHLAAAQGKEDIVRLLLDHGANIDARWCQGTALEVAVTSHQLSEKVVKLLLDRGAHVGKALHQSAHLSRTKIARLLLRHGVDVDTQTSEGTVLEVAARQGKRKLVPLLLRKGARVGNALQIARDHGKQRVVQLLLEHGAEVDVNGPTLQ